VKIVLLHAFPFDERMWGEQPPALGEHEVLIPHLYGLGATMDDWARSIAGLGADAAVGASMGGYCAQRLLEHADVRALVLVGSRAEPDTPERLEARNQTIALVQEQGVEALWERQRPVLFREDAEEGVVERARAIALAQDAEELATAVAAMRDRPDSTELVRRTDAKVLVARGEHDPFLSADEARSLSASFHTFEGCGHLPSLERPEEFKLVLEEFFQGV
jgi:pimeloyl-ACP methyl ester carboxylesterase